jgi:hypothetical protein
MILNFFFKKRIFSFLKKSQDAKVRLKKNPIYDKYFNAKDFFFKYQCGYLFNILVNNKGIVQKLKCERF